MSYEKPFSYCSASASIYEIQDGATRALHVSNPFFLLSLSFPLCLCPGCYCQLLSFFLSLFLSFFLSLRCDTNHCCVFAFRPNIDVMRVNNSSVCLLETPLQNNNFKSTLIHTDHFHKSVFYIVWNKK